jgi:hypothetical protein
MNEKSEISRRGAFSLLGLGVALALAAPTAMLVASDAEAETGMERRQERRAGRRERREARRTARHQRREARRGGTPTTTGTKQ